MGESVRCRERASDACRLISRLCFFLQKKPRWLFWATGAAFLGISTRSLGGSSFGEIREQPQAWRVEHHHFTSTPLYHAARRKSSANSPPPPDAGRHAAPRAPRLAQGSPAAPWPHPASSPSSGRRTSGRCRPENFRIPPH